MQTRVGGRAAPPRPTLQVGDLPACHAAFERLQQRVLQLSLQQQATVDDEGAGPSSVAAWQDLVPLCRALRETLHSLRELSHFTREVYETAADVCTRAQDYPEALKALQQLARLIYPALAAQEQQLAAAEAAAEAQRAPVPGAPPGLVLHGRPAAAGAGGASGGSSSSRPGAAAAAPAWDAGEEAEEEWAALAGGLATLDDASIAAALRRPPFRRWPEVAAALALYFACVQQGGQGECRLDTLATLRRLRRPLLGTAEVQGALALHAALAAGDYVSLFRRRAAAPRLVQLVTDAAAAAARERALAAMAAAYRNIAAAAVCRALDLDAGGRQLMLCLKLLADRGHLAAQRALGGLQQEDAPAAADLVFKG